MTVECMSLLLERRVDVNREVMDDIYRQVHNERDGDVVAEA